MLATTEQMRELDRTAIEERGIPSLELMENAAWAVAQAAADLVGRGVRGGAHLAWRAADPGGAAGGGRDTGCGGVQEQRPHPADCSVLRPGEQRRGRHRRRPAAAGVGVSGAGFPGGGPGQNDPGRPGHGGEAEAGRRRSGAPGSGGPAADSLAVYL